MKKIMLAAVLALATTVVTAPASQATVVGNHTVHSTVYPINLTVTGRAALTSAQFNTVKATIATAETWWSTQTDARLTFVTSSLVCNGTTTSPVQISAVQAAAAACGIANTPLNVPVAVFTKAGEAYGASTGMASLNDLLRVPWPADPDYTRRTTSANVLAPTGVTARDLEHEFGHVLSLYHSTSIHPAGTGATTNLDFRWVSNAATTTTDYGDRNDIMGRGNALSDPVRTLLDVQRTEAQYVPPGALPPAGITVSVASGGSVSWDDNTGTGAGLDTFTYSMNTDGDPQLVRLQRTSFLDGSGNTYWTRQVYSLDPGTDVISHLVIGTTYATGDRHIKPLAGGSVLVTN